MRKRLLMALLSIVTVAAPLGLTGATPAAHANGTGEIEYTATGTLPTYPTNGAILQATMSGTITGNAQVTGTSGTQVLTSNVTWKAAPFSGQPIQYQVEGSPYCLAASQAGGSLVTPYTGTINVTSYASAGQVAGQVYRSGDTVLGGVTSTSISFKFTYQRVTAGQVVVVNPGTITVNYANVNGSSGSITSGFVGAGPGVIQYTDASAAIQACVNNQPRSVGFAATGAITAAGS